MSRKKTHVKHRARKVTAPVTAAPEPAADPSVLQDCACVPPATLEEFEDALSNAAEIGAVLGRVEGLSKGLTLPRSAGEARALDQQKFVAGILEEVFTETKSALRKHGPMHSPHEGLAVIMEEFDELREEVYRDRGRQKSARAEAIQLAAMAVRYALDIDPR